MTIRRLHTAALPEAGGRLVLGAAAARHARVLRLRAGDEVELFDGAGRVAAARISSVGETVECEASLPVATDGTGPRITLLLAIPKGSTLDDCVRMATELGVDEIALMQTERSVPRWDDARARSRVERLLRIAVEAAAQCERADIPLIDGPKPVRAWLADVPPRALRIVFAARAHEPLTVSETPEQVWCAVGPEGGFSDDELSAFQAAGFGATSLGRRILRVDTAVASALTVVQDRLASLQAR